MSGKEIVEKLSLEEVGRHFESLGYKVIKLEQPWRHMTGLVKFENEKLFVKMATTAGIGERTKNETAWNRNMNSVWNKYATTFKSPKPFDEGYFQDRYWFVGEYVFGKPLVGVTDNNTNISDKDLERAAGIANNLLELSKMVLLPKDVEHFKEVWQERILQVATGWSKSIKGSTKKLLQFIEVNRKEIDIAASHGDFTPWNIMKSKAGQYYLIDAEAAQMAGLMYYDVAYFYHRVYTKLKRPDLAEKFLNIYKEISKWTEKNDKEFAPVLASRIMGGYFDAERDGVTNEELNRQLEVKLLAGEI